MRGSGGALRPVVLARLVLVCLALVRPAGALRAQTLTLGAAADSALARHPTMGVARARVEGADAGRVAARAAWLPRLTATGSATRFEEPMVVAPLHGFDPASPPGFDRSLFQTGLALDWTVFDGGLRGADARRADAAAGVAAAGEDAAAEALLEEVVGAYTALLGARAQQAAAALQIEALEAELDRAEQRLREGTAARVEVLRAEAALLDARARAATAEAGGGLGERRLARLMGLPPGTLRDRPLADVAPRPDAGPEPAAGVEAGEEGADARIAAARRAVDIARARVDREEAARLPRLAAAAGLNGYGSGAGGYQAEWQAGVRLSWPLFTGGARSAAIRTAEADLREAEAELRRTELAVGAARDVADASVLESEARARALEASVAQWEEVARIELLSLETGAGVQQDYLMAEAALFEARAGLARARYDEIVARAGRARALGYLDRAWIDDALEAP